MPPPDVIFALTGDVRRNSRALRQLRALAGLGCTIDVFTFGPAAVDPFEPGIRLHVLEKPSGSGPAFFARVDRLFRHALQRRTARVYHASDLYVLPALADAARRQGARLVYDARELYPYVAATAGRPWVTAFWRLVEGRYARRADAVFTVSDRIAEAMAAAYDLPRPTVLYNAPPRQSVPPSPWLRARAGVSPGVPLLLHQGQLRADRGGERLVEAMRHVHGAVLVFLGDGSHRAALERRVAAAGLQARVRFVDPVPPDDLLPVTAGADVGLTMLEDTCLNHRYALPNKLFEYLVAGLPVLASDLPELRRVVAGYGVGMVVDPADGTALAAALQKVAEDTAARQAWAAQIPHVLETFGWDRTSQHFLRHYSAWLSCSVSP